jgi:NAD(P) transhydrogenase subunit beta
MLTLALSAVDWLTLAYLLAAVLFIFGLKMLGKVATAAKGNLISSIGMLVATVATFFLLTGDTAISLVWVIIALIIGSAVGVIMATRVQMTAMPQMVALLNGFGGIASLLVATGDYFNNRKSYVAYAEALDLASKYSTDMQLPSLWPALLATGLATIIGAITFTGSLMAFGKLQGVKWAPDQPVQLPGQRWIVLGGLAACLIFTILLIAFPGAWWLVVVMTLLALAIGVLLVIGIGGADMPVIVALLNSYSGLAAAMAGFVLNNVALIITGSLVGSSGLILTNIMCKAMNRSLMNVLFGGMGAAPGKSQASATSEMASGGTATESAPGDAAIVLEAARQVVVVPGYGMAVAQAQHAVKELAGELAERGINVVYAIHPVAGRMPGHMNVLLAEAGVDYDVLLDLEPSNAQFPQSDVALVIGANDVTNPAARHDQSSPLYGMPILNVDQARTVFVIKRSLNPGFAGIQNPLYFQDNTRMIFGDAKKVVSELISELEQI